MENGNPTHTKQKYIILIHSLILPDVNSITLFIFMKPFFFLSKSQNFEAWTKTEKTTEDELLSGRTGQL